MIIRKAPAHRRFGRKTLGADFENIVAATAQALKADGLDLFGWRPGLAINGYVFCADVARDRGVIR